MVGTRAGSVFAWARRSAPRQAPAGRQRGAATVMMALLVGLAVMASTLAVVQQVRSSQDQSLTVHSQTQAQMNAWAGAEMVRQYLEGLTGAQRTALLASVQSSASSTPLEFSSDMGVGAVLLPASTSTNILARVTGITAATSPKARTTATLDLNYGVSSTGGLSTLRSAFKSGFATQLGGTITLQTATAEQAIINIRGDLLSGGYSLNGADTINATGTINLGSNSNYRVLNSNCDVVIDGTTTAGTVNAMRHACAGGTARVSGVATANGSIAIGTQNNGTLAALGRTITDGSCSATGSAGNAALGLAATCATPGFSGVNVGGGNGSASVVKSGMDVYMGTATIGNLAAARDLVITGWNGTVNGTVGRQVVRNGYNFQGTVTTGGASPGITAVQAITIDADAPFNATDYRTYANYAFYVSGTDLKVDIKNVNGVSDGSYFVGTTGRVGAMRYVCSFSGDNCTADNKTLDLCTATTNTSCLSYAASTWTLDTDITAGIRPGVAWFGGNLLASNGVYYNTLIATGNLTTGGTHTTYAPNYAGYSGKVGATTYAPSGICTTAAGAAISNYPVNFCSLANASFDPTAASGLGSYAYMAGSFSGASYNAATYVGGNVALGGSVVNGYVLAGNAFSSGGVSTIRGYISSQGSGATNPNQASKSATLGSNTTIDVRALPAALAAGGAGGGAGGGGGGGTTVSIVYSRYL